MFACFTCGDAGHVKADCPERTRPSAAPAAALASPAARAQPPAFTRPAPTPCQIARRRVTYFGWGRIAARTMGGGGPVVRTEFRDRAGLLPKTEGQLRDLALAQVAESRGLRVA